MNYIAWQMLTGDRAKYFALVFTIAFASFLLVQQVSIFVGILEQITDESWTEHLRRFDRVTADDVSLRDRKLKFHLGEAPPVVTRSVIEP